MATSTFSFLEPGDPDWPGWVVRRVDPVRRKNDLLMWAMDSPAGRTTGVCVFSTHADAERAAQNALAAEVAHHPESVSATYTAEPTPECTCVDLVAASSRTAFAWAEHVCDDRKCPFHGDLFDAVDPKKET